MSPMPSDPAIFVLLEDGELIGMSGTYADDLIRAGQEAFQNLAKATSKNFEIKPPTSIPCDFSGFESSKPPMEISKWIKITTSSLS